DPASIEDGSWERSDANRAVMLSLDPGNGGFMAEGPQGQEKLDPDVVFPVLHGKNGEDGTVQGLLQMAGIPFIGSDTSSSAACMDKGTAKALVSQAEAADQAKCCIIHRSGCDPEEAAEGADAFFAGQYPLFVKPSRAGSSVGITKVKRREDLPQAIRTAFAEDSKVLVEGRVSAEDDKPSKLICDKVTAFSEVSREMWIAFSGRQEWTEKAQELSELFRSAESGNDAVYVFLRDTKSYREETRGRRIRITEELSDLMRKICGGENVKIRAMRKQRNL
ncbi:MAG: hypothetical protein J6D46_05605, partial [Lachnospiraceae bacterium]|nr:hypothetical protein [Lachnospiraceae bacterium]